MEKARFTELLYKWKQGVISAEEEGELYVYIQSEGKREEILARLEDAGHEVTTFDAYDEDRFEPVLQKILSADKGGMVVERSSSAEEINMLEINNEDEDKVEVEVEVEVGRKPRVMHIWRWMAAAAILGFVIWSLVFVLRQGQDDNSLRQAQTDTIQDVKAPEVNRAMITLSDGRQVYLDQVGNGSLAKVSGVEVIKEADGKIVYRGSSSVNREMVYNTLTNPRGSRVIDITLSDGSRVWLNAGSSLRYPVVFGGVKREVELEGEGYFEVNSVNRHPDRNRESIVKGEYENSKRTPGEKVPFYVRSGEVVTEVLGTHFNVNAYEDEGEIRVTLLEGSVSVNRENMNRERVKLVPGQSAFVKTTADEAIQVKRNVDIEEVMAWKNGVFKMNSADIGTIMRQVARWYDVEVVYESGMPKGTISGEVPRSLSLAKVLRVYEISGVNFTIEGKKVVVK